MKITCTNIVDISCALCILRIQYESTQTQFEVGDRDVNNIWVSEIIRPYEGTMELRKDFSTNQFLKQSKS